MNYILKDENAVYYECGYSCDNSLFLKTKKGSFFITDARYGIEAMQYIKNSEVIVSGNLIKDARILLRKLSIKELIYNPLDFTLFEFELLSKDINIDFKPRLNFSQQKRVIKSQDEIEILAKSAQIGKECFEKFATFISSYKGELSEEELFYNASLIFQNFGKTQLSFSPIVALNQNAAKAHALPTSERIKNLDLLLLDAGVKFQRYCSDRTRTAQFKDGVLNFSKEQKFDNSKMDEVYNIVKEAQELSLKFIKPGVFANDIDRVARDFIAKNGFKDEFFHSTGHGVGLDIHELPYINSKNRTLIKEGMVFSVEPGIYIKDEFGVRIEDVVVVTKDGCRVL